MVIAPLIPNESQRLLALQSYQLLDSLPEKEFDEITHLAATVCQVPIALISLLDDKRQWFKSKVGLHMDETNRAAAFCAHAMADAGEVLVVPDANQDERFFDNPLVTGAPDIVFYAGVPLINRAGFLLGTLCVIDQRPRRLSLQQMDALKALARLVLEKMEARKEKLLYRQKEDAHGQELRLLHQAVNASSDQLYIIKPDVMEFVAFNKSATEQLGYTKEELLEIGPHGLNPCLHKEELQAVFIKVLEEKEKGYRLQTTHRNKNGGCFPVEILLSYSQEQDGLIVAAVRNIAAQELSARKLKEKDRELIKVGQELKMLMDNAPLLIIKTNNDLQISYANDDEGPEVGSPVLNLFPASYRQLAEGHLRQALDFEQEQTFHYEKESAGKRLWFLVQAKRINQADGKASLLLLIENITQAKELEIEKDSLLLELKAKVDALQQYNYIVSHNLRGPIANILGLSDLLLNMPEHLSKKEKTLYLKKLNDATLKIDEVIQDLTTILTLQNPLGRKRDFIDFREMIDSTITSLQTFIDEAQAEVKVWVDPSIGSFTSFRSYVQSILYNLINNAIKYRALHRPLKIAVEVSRQPGKLVVKVTDNGQGINLYKHGDQLFGLYKRFNPYVEGKGLGLHMTKVQVDALGGTIAVESEEDRGTTFTVSFVLETADLGDCGLGNQMWIEEAS